MQNPTNSPSDQNKLQASPDAEAIDITFPPHPPQLLPHEPTYIEWHELTIWPGLLNLDNTFTNIGESHFEYPCDTPALANTVMPDTPALANTVMQEPAPSTHITEARPVATPTTPTKRIHGCTGKAQRFLKPEERPTWNCYRCNQCGFTDKRPGVVTNHIKYRADHDAWTVGASWVGDDNIKLARGFIAGEPIMVRLKRLEDNCEQRSILKREAEEKRALQRNNEITNYGPIGLDPDWELFHLGGGCRIQILVQARSVFGRGLPELRGVAEDILKEVIEPDAVLRWFMPQVAPGAQREVRIEVLERVRVNAWSDGLRQEGVSAAAVVGGEAVEHWEVGEYLGGLATVMDAELLGVV
ncbi:hypothetical protein EV426DRAFT_662614 [Tirmania nivea]|nr:hypothetical protein EV426DRAFT_662614 [Tirmania nivea]